MATKLTERERLVLAAYFARSNMGMDRAKRDEVARLMEANSITLFTAVADLCQQFCESEDHYKIFCGEAKSWLNTFSIRRGYGTRETVMATWPHTKEAFWPQKEND